MNLNKNIRCIGTSGNIKLLVNGSKPPTNEQPCLTIAWSNDNDLDLTPTILGKYDILDRPMTYMAFDMYTDEQAKLISSILSRYLTDSQVEEINKHLPD